MKLKGIIEDFKKRKKLKMIIVKIFLGISLELLQVVWGQFGVSSGSVQFQIVPCSSLYFSRPTGPFQCIWC